MVINSQKKSTNWTHTSAKPRENKVISNTGLLDTSLTRNYLLVPKLMLGDSENSAVILPQSYLNSTHQYHFEFAL